MKILLFLIRAYQYALRPFFGNRCRYLPSCSEYMSEAIVKHGAGRGLLLGSSRLCRCHPFAKGGFDPVP